MSKAKDRRWVAPDPQTYIVQMKELTSSEVYLSVSGEQRPVLAANTLDVRRGESWAIAGTEAFEVELLLQMMGCVRPYGSGSCKLVERGMMRKKRRILPHVFFVGGSGMAVPNMSVLEYLMFATQHSDMPAKDRQIAFLEMMLRSDCYGWCFTPIKALTPQERSVLSLMAASFSRALLLVFPYFYTETSPELRGMLTEIAKRVTQNRAALVIGTCDPTLAESACTNAAFLLRGTLRESGTIEEIKHKWDRRDYIVTADDPEALRAALDRALPQSEVRLRDNAVEVYHREGAVISQSALLDAIAAEPVRSLRRSEKTLENAFLEAQHDLSNELL